LLKQETRRLQNEEFYNMYSLQGIIKVIESGNMRLGCQRGTYIVIGNVKERKCLGKTPVGAVTDTVIGLHNSQKVENS
jgi:hypothetical protein